MSEQKELTYGQKAVGLTFNPSGDQRVQRVKELYAEIIDICDVGRRDATSREHDRLFDVAIRDAQSAQMWAVKAITWRESDERVGP